MRKPSIFAALVGSLSLFQLAGCGLGSSTARPALSSDSAQLTLRNDSRGAMLELLNLPRTVAVALQNRHAKDPNPADLAVSDFGTNAIEILDKKFKLKETITAGLNLNDGDWYDRRGNLYVANYGGDTVTEYPPNGTAPSFTYSDAALHDPVSVTVDSSGNVFVANNLLHDVVEYPQQENIPSFDCDTGLNNEGVAVDHNGDVFVSGNSANQPGSLVEFDRGLAGCSVTTLGAKLGYAGGLIVDKHNNLLAIDQHAGVDIIAPPYSSVTGTCGSGYSGPFHDALNKKQNELFVANLGAKNLKVLAYPACTLIATLGSANGLSEPGGVAASITNQ
jgi:hypothetical protein